MDKLCKNKITYVNLSWPLKIAVIGAWLFIAMWLTAFFIGFVQTMIVAVHAI